MPRQARDDVRPALALFLGIALALAPALSAGLAPTALAQGEADQGGENRPNDSGSGEQANRSQQGQREASEGRGEGGPPEDAGRASPVEIRDVPGGFATRAPPDVARPEVAVDARNASARVDRADVEPLDVQLDQVLAFTDEDGDGAYDVGEPVIERQTLPDRPARIVADDANETRTLVYQLDEDEAELRLVFDLGTDHEERVATKFDVVLSNYTFEGNDTHIAVGSRVHVDGGLERVDRDGQPAVVGQQGEEVAYLSWVPTVDIDGDEHPVGSSVHVDAEEPSESAIVYWAYPQGEQVVHDPELGVQDAFRELAGRLAPFALGLAATATILFAGYAVRARGPP